MFKNKYKHINETLLLKFSTRVSFENVHYVQLIRDGATRTNTARSFWYV